MTIDNFVSKSYILSTCLLLKIFVSLTRKSKILRRYVLVVSGYDGAEYPPYKDLINVGDIHSCEPWLYSECLKKNFAARTKAWRMTQKGHFTFSMH